MVTERNYLKNIKIDLGLKIVRGYTKMGRPNKHQKRYENSGRPSRINADVLQKLEDAFMNAFTDEMACVYAGISARALYNYCKGNPEFMQRKTLLKLRPDLTAQRQLVSANNTIAGARWWAEHRMKDFMPKTKVEQRARIQTQEVIPTNPRVLEAIKVYKAIRARQRDELRQSMP